MLEQKKAKREKERERKIKLKCLNAIRFESIIFEKINQEIDGKNDGFFCALFRLSGFVREHSKHMIDVFGDSFESDCIVRSMRCEMADGCGPIRDR